ncbi:DUF4184 family protein [Actinokineospora enzanensis]|uniref:DUF4184 family protein n=1 Tax=Actinokineospora enzanensis TaxID=155975 RepID=UPI0003653631|nr:DUF4184 family protein [Actinokineospora enzanensis]
MPYTISHAAAVLPLVRRTPFVGSALVVGSMSPDLLYFIALEPGVDERSHTWLGLVTNDLPVALVVLALYWAFVLPAVVALAPAWLRSRMLPLPPAPRLNPMGVLWVVVSVLLGGVTHIVWDSFTHHYGWGVEHFPSLREWLWVGMPRYNFLQYLSSVVGVVVLAWWAARNLRKRLPVETIPPRYAPPRRPWRTVVGVVAAGLALAAVRAVTVMASTADVSVGGFARTLAAGVAPSSTQLREGLIQVSICVVTGIFVALAIVGGYLRARRGPEPTGK